MKHARNFNRVDRVAHQLQKELALILQREIRDDRIGMVTISEVKVSRDLAYAKVYVTFLCLENQDSQTSLKALKEHEAQIRMSLGQKIRLRLTPEINFIYDDTLVEGIRISNLINEIVREDDKKKED